MVDFIFSRTIAVHRPDAVFPITETPPGIRTLPYHGVTAATETAILSGIAASLQIAGGGKSPDNKLPSSISQSGWKVYINGNDAPAGSILNRDIVIDDAGNRYQVTGVQLTPLGTVLNCTILEV